MASERNIWCDFTFCRQLALGLVNDMHFEFVRRKTSKQVGETATTIDQIAVACKRSDAEKYDAKFYR